MVVLSLLAAAVYGCTTTTPCYPGDYRACTCDGPKAGYQQCQAPGELYGACNCSALPLQAPPDDGGAIDDASDGARTDGGLLGFLQPCTVDAQCQSNYCGAFPSKGSHCSMHCKTTADCPAPSPKCNPMGQCAVP